MPIPDEKARAWTRPDDYWPPRRPARSGRPARNPLRSSGGGDPLRESRPMLGTIPFVVMMVGFAILAIAMFVTAWPGHRRPFAPPPATAPAPDSGTAARGWIDRAD